MIPAAPAPQPPASRDDPRTCPICGNRICTCTPTDSRVAR